VGYRIEGFRLIDTKYTSRNVIGFTVGYTFNKVGYTFNKMGYTFNKVGYTFNKVGYTFNKWAIPSIK
jgi:hypothetical protein